MYNEKYTSIELSILLFILLNSYTTPLIVNLFKGYLTIDIIISFIFSFLLGLLFLKLYLKLYNNDIIDNISKNIFLKIIVSLIIIFSISINIIYFLTENATIIKDILLPNENIKVLIMVILLTSSFLSLKGLKSISISSNIFFIIYLLVVLISFSFNVTNIETLNLMPIKFKIESINFFELLTFTTTPLLFTLIIPKKEINDYQDFEKKIKKTYIIFYIYLLIKILFIISILGTKYYEITKYPEITMLKSISIFNFFERLEELLIINIFIEKFITISMLLCYLNLIIKKYISKKYINFISIITILLICLNVNEISKIFLLTTNIIFIITNMFLYKRKYRI